LTSLPSASIQGINCNSKEDLMNLASFPKQRWMQGFAKQASKEAYNELVNFFKEVK
jgi:hypothetical protein